MHRADSEVCSQACLALANLSTAAAGKAIAARGVDLIVDCLRLHRGDKFVCLAALLVLENVADRHAGANLVVTFCAIVDVLHCLRAHGEDEQASGLCSFCLFSTVKKVKHAPSDVVPSMSLRTVCEYIKQTVMFAVRHVRH